MTTPDIATSPCLYCSLPGQHDGYVCRSVLMVRVHTLTAERDAAHAELCELRPFVGTATEAGREVTDATAPEVAVAHWMQRAEDAEADRDAVRAQLAALIAASLDGGRAMAQFYKAPYAWAIGGSCNEPTVDGRLCVQIGEGGEFHLPLYVLSTDEIAALRAAHDARRPAPILALRDNHYEPQETLEDRLKAWRCSVRPDALDAAVADLAARVRAIVRGEAVHAHQGTTPAPEMTDAIVDLRARLAKAQEDGARAKTDEPLARFGAAVLQRFHNNGERGDVDGGWLQEAAAECGVIATVTRTTPCGSVCPCAEFHGSDVTVECYPIARYARAQELAGTGFSAGTVPAEESDDTFAAFIGSVPAEESDEAFVEQVIVADADLNDSLPRFRLDGPFATTVSLIGSVPAEESDEAFVEQVSRDDDIREAERAVIAAVLARRAALLLMCNRQEQTEAVKAYGRADDALDAAADRLHSLQAPDTLNALGPL